MKKLLLLVLGFVICNLVFAASAEAADWSQDAGNAQRTGATSEDPLEPWIYKWSFNGADANGGTGNHLYDAPKEARTITGNGNLYVPAGTQGLYTLNLSNGTQVWRNTNTSFNATPAYDDGFVYAGGFDGNLYKINALTGQFQTYQANSPINKAPLVVNGFVYVVPDNGRLHKINSSTLNSTWIYTSGSTAATPPSYSPSRDIVIFATNDLYIHAVNNIAGTQKWRVKPSTATITPGFWNYFDYGWPVIAEKSGIVLIRLHISDTGHWSYPGTGSVFPNTNTEVRNWLNANPQYKNLFALNLDTGLEKFTAAVGHGSTEDYDPANSISGGAIGVMGSQPVVKTWPNGDEVAYIHFRNGQSNTVDWRWDSHLGEMVLDSTTIPNFSPGDLRFVRASRLNGYGGSGYDFITDEQTPLTFAGDTVFNSHWAGTSSHKITNRADSLGLSYTSPIETSKHPPIVRSLFNDCANKNTTTHWTTCTNLSYVTDGNGNPGRYFNGPGWWAYWGVVDPPGWRIGSGNTAGSAYSAGFLPRYTYVSSGYIIVEGNGGDIMVLHHNGSTTPIPTPTPVVSPSSMPISADINNDGKVDALDIKIILENWLLTKSYDQNQDMKINTLDFAKIVAVWMQPMP